MAWHSRKIFLIVLLLSTIAANVVNGQWKIVNPNIDPDARFYGAMQFRDGIVWAGSKNLWTSHDSGRTWQQNIAYTNGGIINDISFFDKVHGIIATRNDGFQITTDGGNTWVNEFSGTHIAKVGYNGSSSIVHALAFGGIIYTSADGGVSWSKFNVSNGTTRSFAIASNGTLYVQSSSLYDVPSGSVFISTDLGQTWNSNPELFDGDCYTVSVDSCDPKRLYLVNEQYLAPTDSIAKFYYSGDGGRSWQITDSHLEPYLSGSMSTTSDGIFLGALDGSGVHRSMDRGLNWSKIGGPDVGGDTRNIAVVNDNVILVTDVNGNCWRTTNSGGDSVTSSMNTNSPISLAVSTTNQQFNATSCNAEDSSIKLGIIGCSPKNGTLDSVWIAGSSAIIISDTRHSPRPLSVSDSILVQYSPSASGRDTAELHIRYNLDGGDRDTIVTIIGYSGSTLFSAPVRIHREAGVSYFASPDSLLLAVDLNPSVNSDFLWQYVHDISGTYTFDSSVVTFGAYWPPSGWSISAIINHGDSVDFSIHNISSKLPVQPLDLGIAEFLPTYNRLVTSDVKLSNFIMHIDSQSIAPCLTDDEDQHWSVKVLVADGVTISANACGTNIFFIHPNPANGNVWLTSSADIGDATIEIYDMLGAKRSETVAALSKDNPVELSLPPADGVYNIVVRYSGGSSMVRVVRQH